MQARPMQIWKGGMYLGWDHNGAPVPMSQPLTTRQIKPRTSMAPRSDPGTDGHNRMDSTAAVLVSPASIPTPYFPARTVGPMELAHYGGRVPAPSPLPSEDPGALRRVHQQQMQKPHVTPTHYFQALVASHDQRSRTQKGQSRREVCEGSKSARKNCRLNGSLAGGEDDGPDTRRGCRRQEPHMGGGISALGTLAGLKRHQPLDPFGQIWSERSSPSVSALSTSSALQSVSAHSQGPSSVEKEHRFHKLPSHTPCRSAQPDHLKPQAMRKNKSFTDAHIHDFIKERVADIIAGRTQSTGCKGAERTNSLSSSHLSEFLPSKQNTGSLRLKMDKSAPQQVTSTASSEEVCLSSAGGACSPALDCNGNEKWSTAFGKGIPEKHAEMTRNVLMQDGHAEPKPEKDSTEYPKMKMLAADVCAKTDDENPVTLSAVSGVTLKDVTGQHAASEVGNSATQGRYTSGWLANSLEDRDKEPGALRPVSYVGHPEARETGTRGLADNWQAGKMNTDMGTANSIKMSGKEEPYFKSQVYEDISDDDNVKKGEDMAQDLPANRLLSETTIGNFSGTSSKDFPVYEDISDMETSHDESLIIDEPLMTQLSNNVKPIESGSLTNVPALSEHLLNSAQQSCDETLDGDETLCSTEKELCISVGKDNKGPGLLPEVYAPRSLQQQVIYISSDEDPMDPSTEDDGPTDYEIQENGTEAISPMAEEEDAEEEDAEEEDAEEEDAEEDDAEEDWLIIPVAIPYVAFVEADGSHVSQAKIKSGGQDIPPSTTKEPWPTAPMNQLEVFDTLDSFLRASTCPNPCSDADSKIIIISDDELLVPTPTEGNLIPAEPSYRDIVPRCRKRSSSCDTEDSSDYSSTESSSNYLTVSPQCWKEGNCSKSPKKKRKLHSAKPPCTNTLSDSMDDSCVDDVEVEMSLETDAPVTPELKSSTIESDEDDDISVDLKKALTKCHAKTVRTAKKRTKEKGLKKQMAEGAKLNHRGEKGLRSSESKDSGGEVKGPQQKTSLDSEIVQKTPWLAGAEAQVSTSRGLPEPNLLIKKDDSKLSRGTKKNNLVTSANGHHRNKTREEKLRSEKRKMLDCLNGERKVNAFNTRHHLTSSIPTAVSTDHLFKKLQTSMAALQKNKGHSTASTEPPRASSSGGTEPPRASPSGGTEPPRASSSGGPAPARTASSGGPAPARTASAGCTEPPRTASSSGGPAPARMASSGGTESPRTASFSGPAPARTASSGGPAPARTASSGGPAPSRTASSDGPEPARAAFSSGIPPSRTASSGDRNNMSPGETSSSSPYFSCPLPPKKRISHYDPSGDKTKNSIHKKLSLLTQTAPSSSRGQSNSSTTSKSSKPRRHSIDSKGVPYSNASGSTESARQQINKHWQDSYVSTRIARRHSSGPEDARRRASSSKNAAMSEQHDAGSKDAEPEPCPNVAQQQQKSNSCYTASATQLMKRTKNQAKRLTQAKHLRERPQERTHSIGEGYKWSQNPKSGNLSRNPRPLSPSIVEQLSEW